MNILVSRKKDEKIYFRPDTTINRENKDIYIADNISELYYSPVLFAKITKAGKYINPKYISRYIENFSFGILIYEGEGIVNEDYACSSCLDYSSILSATVYERENQDNIFSISLSDKIIFSYSFDNIDELETAICNASKYTSLRIGDMVALELQLPSSFIKRDNSLEESSVKVFSNKDSIIDFKIIY